MKTIKTLTAATTLALLFGACGAKKEAAPTTEPVPEFPAKKTMVWNEPEAPQVEARLKATVFRMSGDYADNVAISLNDDGTLAYYPAPTDLSERSKPMAIGDGWYLNRQGLGPNSVFTKYTFEEYMALPAPPTRQQLIEAVIPGARVTSFRQLPIPASEALADPNACLKYLKAD